MALPVIISPRHSQDNTSQNWEILEGMSRNLHFSPWSSVTTPERSPLPPIQHFAGCDRPTRVTNMQVVPSSRNYAYYQTKINTSQNPLLQDVKDMGKQKSRMFISSIMHGKQIKNFDHFSLNVALYSQPFQVSLLQVLLPSAKEEFLPSPWHPREGGTP